MKNSLEMYWMLRTILKNLKNSSFVLVNIASVSMLFEHFSKSTINHISSFSLIFILELYVSIMPKGRDLRSFWKKTRTIFLSMMWILIKISRLKKTKKTKKKKTMK